MPLADNKLDVLSYPFRLGWLGDVLSYPFRPGWLGGKAWRQCAVFFGIIKISKSLL